MRVLVVGLGWVARSVWLPRLRRHPDFEVVAAVEPDPTAAADADAGVPVYADPAAAFASGVSVDVAFVLTPNSTHAELGGWFLQRGVDVFMEKPTCLSDLELGHLRLAAQRGGGRLALSASARSRTDVRTIAARYAAGEIGTLRLIELGWLRSRGVPRGSAWFVRRDRSGGGVLFDLGWHLVDVATFVAGPQRVADATTIASSDFVHRDGFGASWREPDSDSPVVADVEDTLTSLVRTDTGSGILLRLAWASHVEHDVTSIALHGTEASLVLRTTFGFSPRRLARPTLSLHRADMVDTVSAPAEPIGAEYDRVLDELPGRLAAGRTDHDVFEQTQAVLDVVLACYRGTVSEIGSPA